MRRLLLSAGAVGLLFLSGCPRPIPQPFPSRPTEDTRRLTEKLGRSGAAPANEARAALNSLLDRGRLAPLNKPATLSEPRCFVDGCYVEVSFKDRESFAAFDKNMFAAFEEPRNPPGGPRGRTRVHLRDGEIVATYYNLSRRTQEKLETAMRNEQAAPEIGLIRTRGGAAPTTSPSTGGR